MDEGMGDKVKTDEHHIRKKRYVEISVDRNSFPNHILPSFASEKMEKDTLETQLGREEIGGKFSLGKTGGGGVSGKKTAEMKVGSQEGENEILPYPRFINDKIH